MKFYLLEIVGDIEPELHGPFKNSEQTDELALKLRANDPEQRNGLFPLIVEDEGLVCAGAYSGGFFMGERE